MSRIQPLDLTTAPAASRPLLEAVRSKMGKVPNLLGTLAHAPAALQSYLSLGDALGAGALSATERERIALAVGEANACDYCLAAHTMISRGAGLDADEALLARQGDGSDPRSAALARFAARVTESRGNVTDDELRAFKAAGWEDAHVLEVIAHVALNTLTNYTNHIAATEVDFPVAPALQGA